MFDSMWDMLDFSKNLVLPLDFLGYAATYVTYRCLRGSGGGGGVNTGTIVGGISGDYKGIIVGPKP